MKEDLMLLEEVIQDRLSIWTDHTQTVARGAALRRMSEKAGFEAKRFAKELGLNRTVIYQEKVRLAEKIVMRLRDLTRVIDNAFVLFENDEEKVMKWLFSPSTRFSNMMPFSVVMAGNGEKIYNFQENLRYDHGEGPKNSNHFNN